MDFKIILHRCTPWRVEVPLETFVHARTLTPSPFVCDLDLQPTWKNVSNAFCSSRTTTVQNHFWNPCINVQALARTSSIYDHFDLYLAPVTFTFNLPKIIQMALFLLKGNNCAKLFWNPCINVQVMLRTSSIHVSDHLYLAQHTGGWWLTPFPGCLRLGLSWFNWWVSFAPEFQCCYFCESSCLFYLSFNFDFYVSKIMHLWVRNLPRKPNN